MTPYSRFRLISNTAVTALVAGALCAVWPVASDMIAAAAGGLTSAYWGGVAGSAVLVVLAAVLMSEAVFPALFQWSVLRKLVLGRSYAEGTWLQAERGPSGTERLTVLHIRPAGFSYDVSGYSLNQENEIESNRMALWSRLDGPVLNYAWRNLMPDGAGTQAQGVSELMFEQRRGAPKAYAGYGAPAGAARRFHIEGVKLTKWSERRRLKKLEQRGEVVARYWDLFFGVAAGDEAAFVPPVVQRPVVAEAARAPFVERRDPGSVPEDGAVIPRRRASDWRQEDATPTADRIRARMMADIEEAEEVEDEDLYDEEIEDEVDAEEDELMLEDEVEIEGDEELEAEEDEEYEAEEDEELEAEEDDEYEAEEDEEVDAEAEDEFEDDAGAEDEEDAAEAEPVRIRQRHARR